jgi:energy-coupling factor transporter ATP-binding protein EcfA2
MRIAALRIQNFRGIKSAEIRFAGHVVLVGPNNCGKTTIIEALALLFGRDRLVRPLTEHDFFGGDPQPADRVLLIATIVDFEKDDPRLQPDWFRDGRGVPTWFDEASGALHPTREQTEWKLACQVAFCARFDRPTLEVDTRRYFYDGDDQVNGDPFADEHEVTALPSHLVRDIGFFLVPANRTWDRIISFGSELFRRIVHSVEGKPSESVLFERDRLRKPEMPLEADPQLLKIVESLNSELAAFFLEEPTLALRITATDSEAVLDAVTPHYRSAASPALPARRYGSGLVSLQGLLLLLQLGRRRSEEGQNFWMALEEPELHVPPPLQRRLVRRLQALSAQTFVTTHSPLVAAMSDPVSVSFLRNAGGTVNAVALQEGPLPAATPNSIRSLFQLRRIETIAALMHDVVLIPEGKTDHDWLQLLLRALDVAQGWANADVSNFGAHVGVVPASDGAVLKTFETLSRLHPKISVLVDGDAPGITCADTLRKLATPPLVVLRWPDGWVLEDVVIWILSANHEPPMAVMSTIVPTPRSVSELGERLKSHDRSVGGLKGDQLAYETIADAIASSAPCRSRVRELLDAMTDAVLERPSPRFAPDRDDDRRVQVFQP